MRAAIVTVFVCGLCLGVAGFAVAGVRAGLGVVLGGLIATANLWVFARVGHAFVAREGHAAPWAVLALLKMALLFGGVWLILKAEVVPVLSLLAGYTALPVGITVASLFGPRPPAGGAGDDEKETRAARPDKTVINDRP